MTLSRESLAPFLAVCFSLLAFFVRTCDEFGDALLGCRCIAESRSYSIPELRKLMQLYGIAVSKDHVDAWLPFISDCGNLTPESHIFGILLNFSGFFFFLTIYFIYKKVDDHFVIYGLEPKGWKAFNVFLMLLGWASTVGLIIVANFQEGVMLTTHDVGAFLFFIGIVFYFFGYIAMSYAIKPRFVSIHMTNVRVLINLVITALLAFHMVCLFAEPFVKKGAPAKKDPANGIERPKYGDAYYDNHLATTISEWLLALIILLQVLTLMLDLAGDSGIESSSNSPRSASLADVANKNATITTAYANHVFREEVVQGVPPSNLLDTYQTDTYARRLPRVNMQEAFKPHTDTELMHYPFNYNPHPARSHRSEYY